MRIYKIVMGLVALADDGSLTETIEMVPATETPGRGLRRQRGPAPGKPACGRVADTSAHRQGAPVPQSHHRP